jgi:hypothetical protein
MLNVVEEGGGDWAGRCASGHTAENSETDRRRPSFIMTVSSPARIRKGRSL